MKSSTACWIFLNNHLISVFDYLARVWHALVTTMDTSKQIISVILANWSSTEKQKLTRRSELKMTMNNVRVQQIKEDFWKVRLAELIIHEERFLQHELVRKWNLKKNLCTYIYIQGDSRWTFMENWTQDCSENLVEILYRFEVF